MSIRSLIRIALRSIARATVGAWLRVRSSEIAIGANAIVIAPHPDDESLGCAGLICAKRQLGAAVHVIFLTDGAASHPGHPTVAPRELSILRRSEAHAAAALLGVPDDALTFLDLPDGSLAHMSPEQSAIATDKVAAVIERLGPSEIYLPLRRDGSSEHEAAFNLVAQAALRDNRFKRIIEYPVWSWWSPRLLCRASLNYTKIFRHELAEFRSNKRRALEVYRSQALPTAPWRHPVLPGGFIDAFSGRTEYFFEKPLHAPASKTVC